MEKAELQFQLHTTTQFRVRPGWRGLFDETIHGNETSGWESGRRRSPEVIFSQFGDGASDKKLVSADVANFENHKIRLFRPDSVGISGCGTRHSIRSEILVLGVP